MARCTSRWSCSAARACSSAIARAVCRSLAEAHDLGIVHRDLKPTNIHIEAGEQVKVLDFGIAKIVKGNALDNAELTRAGQMIGTFDYMAPEQMVGGDCGPPSDIFTLGVVIYEMIAGERPFGDQSSAANMLAALVSVVPTPLSRISDAPPALDAVLARCLHPEPIHRYREITELAAALEQLLQMTDDRQRTPDITDRTFAAPVHDDATWIDDAPAAPPPGATTLPGVQPPKPGDTWRSFDPSRPKKKR